MTYPALPRDIVAIIVSGGSFDTSDLLAISLVSQYFRDEAQRALFRQPNGHYLDAFNNAPSAMTSVMFLRQIIKSPDRLALMVLSYTITAWWFDIAASDKRWWQSTLFDRLSVALPLMTNLKALQYHAANDVRPPSLIFPIFRRCKFTLEMFGATITGARDARMIPAFLKSQPRLRELWISGVGEHAPRHEVMQNLCPRLESLGGDTEIVNAILRGRNNIRHIRWLSSRTNRQNNWDLTEEFKGVRFLENLLNGPPFTHIFTERAQVKNLLLLKTDKAQEIFRVKFQIS